MHSPLPVLGLLPALLWSGCASAPPRGEPAPEAPAEYPAAAWVPAEPTYALVAARVTDLVAAVRELAAGVGLFADVGIDQIDRDLRKAAGLSPLSIDDLAEAGIDVDRGAALWSTARLPTLALPVRDRKALLAALERGLPLTGVKVRRMGDGELFRRGIGDKLAIEWVITEDWALVRVAEVEPEPTGAWVRPLLRGPPGGHGGRVDLQDAAAAGRRRLSLARDQRPAVVDAVRPRPAVAGFVRLDRLWPKLSPALPERARACGLLARPRGRVLLAAEVGWRGGSGMIAVELAPGPAAALREQLAPPPPPGLAALRADAAAWLEWALDPRWPWQAEEPSRCRPLPARPDLVDRLTAGGAVTAGRVVASDIRLSEGVFGRAAAHLRVTDKGVVDRLMRALPLPARPGPVERIAGVEVSTLHMPLLPAIRYRLDGGQLAMALGADAMAMLLGPGPPPPPGDTVLAAGLVPPRIDQLAMKLRATASALGLPGDAFYDRTAQRLGRWQAGEIRLFLDGDDLVLAAAMRLQ